MPSFDITNPIDTRLQTKGERKWEPPINHQPGCTPSLNYTDPIDTLLQPEVEDMLHLLHHRRVSIVQVRLCRLEQKHHKRIQILKLRFEGFRNLVLVIVILTTPFRPSPGRTSDLKVTL